MLKTKKQRSGYLSRKVIERNIAYDDVRDKYYVTLNYGVVKGKQIKKTKTYSNKKEAQNMLKIFEADRINGDVIMPNSCTLGEWLDYWLDDVVMTSCAKTTYMGYKYIVNNHIRPILGNIKMQDLNAIILQKYFRSKQNEVKANGKRKLSDNTLRKHHVLLLTSLKEAKENDVIKSNPEEKVKAPKYIKPDIPHYSTDQAKTLIKKIDEDYILKPVVYLAIYTGIRRSEIAGLQWSDIDYENSIINIRRARVRAGNEIIVKEPKNASSKREVYMSEELAIKLREVHDMQIETKELLGNLYKESSFIVVNQNGIEVNPGYISTLFGRFLKKHGLPEIPLHGLRHSTASILLNSGVPIEEISDILGHADITTTKRVYAHWEDKTHKKTMQEYGKILSIE